MLFAAASRREKGNDLRAKNQGRRRKATRAIARAVSASASGPMMEAMEGRVLLSGLTIITHGFNSGIDTWVRAMANEIAAKAGGTDKVSQYNMVVDNDAGSIRVRNVSLVTGTPAFTSSQNSTGESIVRLDWSDLDGLSGVSTSSVADAVVDYLLQSPGWSPLLDSPIHLVGHSRGASLMARFAQRLAERGIWVDHFTSLDPHPVDGVGGDDFFNWHDAPMNVWDNVVFADNYWRQDYLNPLEPDDFDGESVPGAANYQLSDNILQRAGYHLAAPGHSDVHLWYHGTIGPGSDSTWPTGDGYESIGGTWYGDPHPARADAGFYFSSIVDGVRPASGTGIAFGGTARRVTSLSSQRTDQWPNIGNVSVGASAYSIGDRITVNYRYQDYDGSSDVYFYLDTNRNPYDNSNLPSLAHVRNSSAGQAVPFPGIAKLDTSSGVAPSTQYWVAAKITDSDGHTRWAYAPRSISLQKATEQRGTALSIDSFTWDDPDAPPASRNGLPEGRERVRLKIGLHSAQSISSVRGTLSSAVSGVVFANGTATRDWPNIPVDGSFQNTAWFDMDLNFDSYAGALFSLHMTYESGGKPYAQDITFQQSFPRIGDSKPFFVVDHVIWRDDINYQPNGQLEGGEDANCDIYLRNVGNVGAADLTVQLTDASDLNVKTDVVRYPDMPARSAATKGAYSWSYFWVHNIPRTMMGTKTADITITYAGGSQVINDYPLLDVHAARYIAVEYTSRDFGLAGSDRPVEVPFKVLNAGSAPLTVTRLDMSHPDSYGECDGPCGERRSLVYERPRPEGSNGCRPTDRNGLGDRNFRWSWKRVGAGWVV